MDYSSKKMFREDLSRNGTNKISCLYLWCFRTLNQKKFSVYKFWAKAIIKFYSIFLVDIETSKVGGGLRLPHLNGIFIHSNASLGNDCTILQQVTIGANEHKMDYNKAPTIGNRVYFGAGAKIIGDISLGDDVRVGANAVVTKDVPAGMTVVGYNKIISSKIYRKGII